MIRRAALSLVVACAVAAMAGPASAATPIDLSTDAAAQAGIVRLMAVGDVVLGQSTGRRIIKSGFGLPWRSVSSYLDQAELFLINLECPISARGTSWTRKKYTLRARPGAAPALVAGGVDIVNLANNHTLDYGATAFADTLATLDALGVSHIGGGQDEASAHAPVIVELNGLRIGFLGYALYFAPGTKSAWVAGPGKPGLVAGTPDLVSHEVAALKPQVDVVVVTFHGGRTNSSGPDAKVRAFTRAATAAGAALVIGHHPHVLQGYSRVGNTLVAYSLGNFVFAYFSGVQNDSAILDVTLSANGVESFNWIPVVIEGAFPRPARGGEIGRIMNRLKPIQP
jgi:poly-gamma-glutamate synthesis protein (capsule biosynthesis protein)